jgi:hypothetical protein
MASDPEVRALAERWHDLTERTIAGFTGGDPGITESLGRMYEEEGPEKRLPRYPSAPT